MLGTVVPYSYMDQICWNRYSLYQEKPVLAYGEGF